MSFTRPTVSPTTAAQAEHFSRRAVWLHRACPFSLPASIPPPPPHPPSHPWRFPSVPIFCCCQSRPQSLPFLRQLPFQHNGCTPACQLPTPHQLPMPRPGPAEPSSLPLATAGLVHCPCPIPFPFIVSPTSNRFWWAFVRLDSLPARASLDCCRPPLRTDQHTCCTLAPAAASIHKSIPKHQNHCLRASPPAPPRAHPSHHTPFPRPPAGPDHTPPTHRLHSSLCLCSFYNHVRTRGPPHCPPVFGHPGCRQRPLACALWPYAQAPARRKARGNYYTACGMVHQITCWHGKPGPCFCVLKLKRFAAAKQVGKFSPHGALWGAV